MRKLLLALAFLLPVAIPALAQSVPLGPRFVLPYQTVIDSTGVPLNGAQLFFYQSGTNTPLNTYADSQLTTPNANPVVASSAGVFPNIFLSGNYKVVLTDSFGNQIWTADPVLGLYTNGSVVAFSVGTTPITGGSPPCVVVNSTGTTSACIDLTNSYLASGAFSNITGVGTLATGTWEATTIGTAYGGTGATSLGSTVNNSGGTLNCTTATGSQLGCVKPDGSTITIAGGVITASGGSATAVTVGTTDVVSGTSPYCLNDNSGTLGDVSCATLTGTDQTLSGGANVTSYSIGTESSGTYTVDCGLGPLQYLTNGGAFTLAAPSNDGSCVIQVINNSSAGTITLSGFSTNSPFGGTYATTNAEKFDLSITRIDGTTVAFWVGPL